MHEPVGVDPEMLYMSDGRLEAAAPQFGKGTLEYRLIPPIRR